MKKQLLKHELEFVAAVASIGGLVAVFSFQGLNPAFSFSVAAMLFIGYIAFSSFRLKRIMKKL